MANTESAASAKKIIAGVVGIVFVAPLALVLGVAQTSSMMVQRMVESDSSKNIAVMKAEQAWLVGQALTSPRPIGVFNSSPFESGFRSKDNRGAHATLAYFAGDSEASVLVRDASHAVGLSRSKWSISASPDSDRLFASAAIEDNLALGGTYRHEEGHARMFEELKPVGPLRSIPKDASRVLAHSMDSSYQTRYKGLPSTTTPDWRSSWLASLRAEAYADAYACVSTARKSPTSMRECALNFHASRILPEKNATAATALSTAGDSHNVDMASFMAAQLNPHAVSRLDAKGLDELSGAIADASVEWAIARQAKSLGFFSDAGAAWWASEAKAAGLSSSEADAAWNGLRESTQSSRPAAVFDDKRLQAGGIVFHAKGLPEALSSAPDASWRFDGRGGTAFLERNRDPKVVDAVVAAVSKEPFAVQKTRRDASYRGAVSTHAALVSIIGADPVREGDRLSLIATHSREKSGEFERFFARIARAISPAKPSASPALATPISAAPEQAAAMPADPDLRAKLAQRRAHVAPSAPDYSSRGFFNRAKPVGA